MASSVNWSCTCGSVQGTWSGAKSSRIMCYCESCRAFAEDLGAGDIIDAAGGSDLLQMPPDAFTFTQGTQHLAWSKITEKGPVRWFTTCCRTPIANTLGSPALPFLTLQTAYFQPPEATGPVSARVNRKGATGHIEGEMGSIWRVLGAFGARAIKARINGSYRKNPFFDASGAPIAARATHKTPSDPTA